jgi:hypothetical protein
MNNIKKIITERLENARNDYGNTTREPQLELKGQIEAYQDCLNLMQPRTEADILKDFEKLGYKIKRGFEGYYKYNALVLSITIPNYYPDGEELDKEIIINLDKHTYECGNYFYGVPEHITMQEHKLLNELFICWG